MERFTISLDDKLAAEFDHWIADRGYANRSEAVRDLLRAELQRSHPAGHASAQCVACLSYVYKHHERELAQRLTVLQHAHHDLAVSAMHVHLDHDHCLETLILRGSTVQVARLAEEICAQSGVHHGKLNLIHVEVHGKHHHLASEPPSGSKGRSQVTTHQHIKPAH